MSYNKPFKTFSEQAAILISRGLEANNDELIKELKSINYYRLNSYFYYFEKTSGRVGLELLLKHYTFDRYLRMLSLDGLQRIEVSLRTEITYSLSEKGGPFAHYDLNNFNNKDLAAVTLGKIQAEINRSKEPFVKSFEKQYQNRALPLWMAVELLSFGSCVNLYKVLPNELKQKIAASYKVTDTVFISWITALNALRNVCAHHGRLWNNQPGYKAKIPLIKKKPEWHQPSTLNNQKIFSLLSIIVFMLQTISPKSTWKSRFKELLIQYPEIPLREMGMPENWQEYFMWKN